jgi:hypothetical protein
MGYLKRCPMAARALRLPPVYAFAAKAQDVWERQVIEETPHCPLGG